MDEVHPVDATFDLIEPEEGFRRLAVAEEKTRQAKHDFGMARLDLVRFAQEDDRLAAASTRDPVADLDEVAHRYIRTDQVPGRGRKAHDFF